nr:hypothetical protein [Tanacetum cinerariifolium]
VFRLISHFQILIRTPEESEDESNDEEDQELRLSEETRIQEEEVADELYRDININQGRGLQVTQNVEDSHVTLTLVNPDGPQESSSMSSFVTSMLNPTSDVGVESIFTTASSSIVSLQTPTSIMTPSTIATITTSAPIPPPTIPSIILENLPTFNSAFRIDERLRSLETSFSEYRQTNPFVDAVSAIPGIVHQYMAQQMTDAVREAVQIQTDRLQDSLQRENDEFLRNIEENMKKIIKRQVKNQVAFCPGLRFVLDCVLLKFCCVLLQESCVLSKKHYVLPKLRILRFVLETLRFVFIDLAFCLDSTAQPSNQTLQLGVRFLLLPFEQSAIESEDRQHPFSLD